MEQNVNRRGFIGAAIGTGAAAAMTPSIALGHGGDHGHHGGGGSVPKDRRGIQLYTMREKMTNQDEARSVLRFLGKIGYTEVETAGHYGWTAQQFKSELRRAGLRAPAGHDGPGFPATAGWETGYRETLAYAKELGQKFTGFAWFPSTPAFPYESENTWHELAKVLNTAGRIARDEYGLTFFYHNHDFEFLNRFGGRYAYDILQAETDRRYVKFELDLFWITEGGASGVEYLSAHPDWYVVVPRQGPRLGRSPQRGRLRGRRARHARLPRPVRRRRRPRARQALLHRARLAVAVAPGRRRGRVQDREGRDRVPAERALVRKSSCNLVSPASSGWNEIASRLSWRTATG